MANGLRVSLMRADTNTRTESVAFSPDGTRLLAGGGWGPGDDQYLRLWDWRAGRQLRVVRAHRSLLHRVLFSPDGHRFASCAGDALGDNVIKIWTGDGDSPLILKGHSESVEDIGFSPSGDRLISGSWDETVRLWNAVSGARLSEFNIGNKVNCVGFLPDGRRIYSGGYDNVVRIWDNFGTISAPPTRPDGQANLWCLAYSPDGNILATGSEQGTVDLWDARSGRHLRMCTPWVRGPVNNMAFSPDSGRLAVGTGHVPWEDEYVPWAGRSDYDIRIFDVARGEVVGALKGLSEKVSELHYSDDGGTIVTPLEHGLIVVWDAHRFCKLEELTGDRAVAVRARWRAGLAVDSSPIVGRLHSPETIFSDRATGRDVAWFPQPLYKLTRHPSGKIWAGCSYEVWAHQNEARKIEMVALEGRLMT